MSQSAGMVAALGGRFPDSVVLCDDDFTDDPNLHGFEQLYSGAANGIVGWDRHSMVLSLENEPSASCTAIKRLAHWQRFTSVTVEAWVSLAQFYGDTRIRSVELGIDQARRRDDGSSARAYFAVRRVFTEVDGTTAADRWEMKTGTDDEPTYTPIPGQGYATTPLGPGDSPPTHDGTTPKWKPWPPNERKRNRVYIAAQFDVASNTYLGARFGRSAAGTLDSDGSNPLTAFAGQIDTDLGRFDEGLNVAIDLRGLVTGSKTAALLYVDRVRVSGR